jgi:hypothetical protein
MNHKELADYIEADIETRYKIHKAAYFEKHPNATLDKFHSFTVTHLIDQTEKLKNVNRATGKTNEEIDLYNAEIEVLDYIQNLKGEPLNDIYLINSNFWEQEKTKLEYKGFQREIEKHGFFNVKAGTETVKFYSPYLTVVLTSIELPVKSSDTQAETIINSWEFLMTYIKGYKRGEQYFETEHKVSQDIFYGTGFKEYANDIHRFYFREKHGSNKGWVYVKNTEPHVLTHKEIEEIGYYSGLVNKVEELIKKYPEKFAMFEKHELQTKQLAAKTEQETPKTFEELFYNPEHAEICLRILSELQPPVIDSINNYIGNLKGVFPLWVEVLKKHKPQPLIKHFKNTVYKDLLNQKIKGLNLTKDASEFRKQYKRIENNKIDIDIKAILSQYSQSGKLGK